MVGNFACIAFACPRLVTETQFHSKGFILCPSGTEVGWYGGVVDLNPAFLERQDATDFHKILKEACDKHDRGYYPRFKKW